MSSLEDNAGTCKASNDATTPVNALEHLQYIDGEGVAQLTHQSPTCAQRDQLCNYGRAGACTAMAGNGVAGHSVGINRRWPARVRFGSDLKDFEQIETHEAAARMSRRMQSLMSRLTALPTPVNQRGLPRWRLRGCSRN
jgi:hypothetical protein